MQQKIDLTDLNFDSFLIVEFQKLFSSKVITFLQSEQSLNHSIPKHFKRINSRIENKLLNQAILSVNIPGDIEFCILMANLSDFLKNASINFEYKVLSLPINVPKSKVFLSGRT